MQRRFFWGPLLAGLLLLAGAAAIGTWAYDAGVAHGIAEASRQVAVPVEGAGRVYVWPAPWHGYGFGFFPIFPFIAFFVIIVALRGLFWRRMWYSRGYGHGYGRCGRGDDGVPPMFEEWHRRAHEQDTRPAAPTQG